MNKLANEAVWAMQQLVREQKLSPQDSAVLFVSWNNLDSYLFELKNAWQVFPHISHAIAIKTQPHLSVLKHLVKQGFGLEAATWEEVQLALKAGCPPHKIVFDSPVKRKWEIEDCAQKAKGILLNANSLDELERLQPHAKDIQIGLRINPLIETHAPDAYQVSTQQSKFGVSIHQRSEILQAILQYSVEVLHVHASSSMNQIGPAVAAVKQVVSLAREANELLRAAGVSRRIKILDIGGGLQPEAPDQNSKLMRQYTKALAQEIPDLARDFELITEFGQWIHYYTGYAYSEVEYVNQQPDIQMIFVHLGADFLLRDVYLKPRGITWLPLRNFEPFTGELCATHIAGPLCFAKDFLAHHQSLPALKSGDGLLMLHTGSNAYALWSRHTSRTIPAMYGVDYQNKKIELLSERFNPFL